MNKPTFADSPFMSAKKKRKIHKAMFLFFHDFFDEKYFTKELYEYLHINCNFMAMTNKKSFWQHFFGPGREDATKTFLENLELELVSPLNDEAYKDIDDSILEMLREFKEVTLRILDENIQNRMEQDMRAIAYQLGYQILGAESSLRFDIGEAVEGNGRLTGEVQVKENSVIIRLDGFRSFDSDADPGEIVILELAQGDPRLVVWDDINSQDPKIVKLLLARKSNREKQGGENNQPKTNLGSLH